MKLTSWLSSLKNGVARALRGSHVKRRGSFSSIGPVGTGAEGLEDRTLLNAVTYETNDPDGIYDATSLQVPPNNPSIPFPIITIRVFFQGNVTVGNWSAGNPPRLFFNTFSIAGDPNDPNYPGVMGTARYLGGNVTNAPFLDFEYDVQNGENTPGPLQPVPELTVIGGTNGSAVITDGAGTVNMAIIPTFGASADGQIIDLSSGLDKFIYIDTRPVIYFLGVDSTTPDSLPTNLDPSQGPIRRPYRVGDAPILVTVEYTEPVAVTGTPIIWLNTNGIPGLQTAATATNAADRQAIYISGSGTNILTFQYIIEGPAIGAPAGAGDNTLDLDYTDANAIQLLTPGDLIMDQDFQQQNAINTVLGVSPTLPGSLGRNRAIQIDTKAPAVGLTPGVTAVNPNGTYGVGQTITIRVSFDEAVFLTGSPTLTLATGAVNRVAEFGGFDGTDTLLFNYEVQPGDISLDLDYVNPNSLNLNGGSLTDVAGNNANITLPTPGGQGSLSFNRTIVIDTDAVATNVTSPVINGNYGIGQVIPIQVVFNKPVTVFGTPQLILDLDDPTDSVVVNYSSGSGSNVLVFNYTIQPGHNTLDLDYITTPNALILNGGSIIDNASNGIVDVTLPAVGGAGSLGFNKNIRIDTTVPTLSSVTASASVPDGTYVVGQQIPIQVRFSEAVTVTGVPQITIDTNGIPGVQPFLLTGELADAVVNYTSGSGTNTLTFLYTVQSGHNSLDLDALLLSLVNNSRIRDLAGNDLAATGTVMTLPSLNSEVITNVTAISNVNAVSQVTNVVVGNVVPGMTYSFTVAGFNTNYTALPSDTQQTIATALRQGLAFHPSVGATSVGNTIQLTALNAGTPFNVTLNAGNLTQNLVRANVVPVAQRTDVNVISVGPGVLYTLTVNGVTFTYTANIADTLNTVANNLRGQINSHVTIASQVTATGAGSQIIVTSNTPGTPFTLATGFSLAGNRNLVIDSAPIVTNVTSPTVNGTYVTGQTIQIDVQFNEIVTVTGTPTLLLETDGVPGASAGDAVAIYNGGSGTNTLTFLYSIGADQFSVDLSYVATNSLQLNGGTIVDADGQAATGILTLPAVGAAGSLIVNKDLQVDDNVNNDPPVNIVPGSQTTTEDVVGGLIFSTVNGNLIQVRDVDVGAGTLTITLVASHGTITVPITTGLTVNGNGTDTVTLDGDLATINARLDGLIFQPDLNVNSSATSALTNQVLVGNLVIGATYTLTVDNVVSTYTAGLSDTRDSVAAALAAGLAGHPNVTATSVGNIVQVEPIIPGGSFAIVLNTNNLTHPGIGFSIISSDQGNTGAGGTLIDSDFISVNVTAVNDAPVANDIVTQTAVNVTRTITLQGTDVEIGALLYSIIQTPSNGTLSLNNGVVQYTPNSNFIGTDTFTYQASDGSLNSNTATVTITVVPSLNFGGAPDVSNTEGDVGNKLFAIPVTLSHVPSEQVTIDFTTIPNTALNNLDFVPTSGTLTFLPGEQTATILVPVVGDLVDENPETFFIQLSNPVNTVLLDTNITVTILNDDGISISDVTLIEGNSGTTAYVFNVTLSTAVASTVTVSYQTADSTAMASNADYISTSGSLTFLPGETAKTVTVFVNGDNFNELNETFFVNLLNPSGASLAKGQGVGLIVNDDAAPILTIGDIAVNEGQSGVTNFVFTVNMNAVSGQTVTMDYATLNGTAAAGTDYLSQSGVITFLPGVTQQTVTVTVLGDQLLEADETFFLNLSNASGATLGDNQAAATIVNDDGLRITDAQISEGNAGTKQLVFTVTAPQTGGPTITVDFATLGGTATSGVDFSSVVGTLSFPVGVTSRTISVPIIGDYFAETNEGFTVQLSNSVNAPILDGEGAGVIIDDDVTPTITINDVSIQEGNTGSKNMVFTITLSASIGIPVTVQYATFDQTTTSGADYVPTTGTVTFPAFNTTQQVSIPILGDQLDESNETFVVALSNPTNAVLGSTQGVGTILDDDPTPTMTINNISFNEGQAGTTTAIFTVSLSNASGQPITVNFQTADGSATLADGDYTANSGTLTFAPGVLTQTISVSVNGDAFFELDETIAVNLSGATNANINDSQGIGTIVNDDATPSIVISDASAFEGNAGTVALQFTVTLLQESKLPATVNYSTASGSALDGNDYQSAVGTLTFLPGETVKTITVFINSDTAVEQDETFFVNLASPTNAVIADTFAIGTIRNEDVTPSITVNDVSTVEGPDGVITNLVFTVTVANPNGQPISVQYSTSNGTAVSNGAFPDYNAQSGTLLFSGIETTKTVTVPILGDFRAEATEQFFLNLSNPTNATLADIQGIGTITNDDNNPPVVSVPIGPYTGVEDQAVALTGIGISDLDAGGAQVSLTISAQNGTITVRTDVINGVTPGDVSNNGTDSVTLSGTLTQIANTLANSTGVVYNGNPNFFGTDSITLVANDNGNTGTGGARTDTKVVQVVLTGVNDAPTLNLTGVISNSVKGNAVAVDNGLTFTDPDNQSNYSGAVITAVNSGLFIGTKDVLSVRNQGKGAGQIGFKKGQITYGGVLIGVATGGMANIPLQITLNNKASAAAVNALLQNITFSTKKGKSLVFTARQISFQMSDGQGGTSAVVNKNVGVVP